VRIVPTAIPSVLIVEPHVHRDERGFFLETYQAARYDAAGVCGPFLQDNESYSRRNTVRGMHLQVQRPQGKLIRVVAGEILDIAADVRRGSPTFGRWVAVRLSAENFRQCYVPPGFAHGFCVLSADAHVEYKCTQLYDSTDEIGIAWNDPTLAIEWPVSAPILSPRDRALAPLSEMLARLPAYGAPEL
jgi:dTDP-4-dehydrorhamnose 3,5-epimerase